MNITILQMYRNAIFFLLCHEELLRTFYESHENNVILRHKQKLFRQYLSFMWLGTYTVVLTVTKTLNAVCISHNKSVIFSNGKIPLVIPNSAKLHVGLQNCLNS